MPVVVVVVALAVHPFLSGPSFVRRITITNLSEFDVSVSVASGAKNDEMSLATVSHRSSVDLQDVIDQGSAWTFRFKADGRDGGELQLGRDQLKRDGWRLQIPDSVAARLRAEGAQPPPFQ